ncbi:hypothetical protein [Mammaliicoccus sciuri]|uniref:hypothetical protein n=1 Tax=Mammaliicoccus sciuri TaxID=1296 RepID=UPI002B263704|nr:hypothetical protein [Mammaliicoccus sciuri]WQL61694.1 hypothetical protein P3T96_15050 [Mammaliicoccus sciuri]
MTMYSTEFKGKFEFAEPVNQDVITVVNGLSNTRRMMRDREELIKITGVDYGEDGEYFIPDNFDDKTAVVDYNTPPSDQPSLWLEWEITEDGKYLQWTGGESFRCYLEWLDYLANYVFVPNGISLNGSVDYQGWDEKDKGTIIIENNQVKLKTDFEYTYGVGVQPDLSEFLGEELEDEEDTKLIEKLGISNQEFLDSTRFIIQDNKLYLDLSDTTGALVPLDIENETAPQIAVEVLNLLDNFLVENND